MSHFSILRQQFLGHPVRTVLAAAKMMAWGHVFLEYGYSMWPAHGPSMLPTFEVAGEYIWVSKRYRYGRGVKVGDVVAYHIPILPEDDGVKRVLGLPGDYVLINSPDSGSDAMLQIPDGHCWLVGDNLPASRDSRMFGPVPMALIRGKVVYRCWPLWPPWRKVENKLQPASPSGKS